jgi:hypothetical protein
VLSRRGAHRSTYTLWSARAGPRPRQRPHPSLAAVQRRASITARPRTGIRWPALEGQDARIEPPCLSRRCTKQHERNGRWRRWTSSRRRPSSQH